MAKSFDFFQKNDIKKKKKKKKLRQLLLRSQ